MTIRVPIGKYENPRWLPLWGILAIALLILTSTFTIGLAPALAQTSAKAVTQDFIDQALRIMRDKQKPVQEKRRELKPLIEMHFDATEMARSSLGYHWRSLTPDQRADFTRVFTDFIEAAYLDKVQDYSGQQVQFGQSRILGEGYAAVDTTIVQAGKDPIPVTYLLEQTGGWKIYDVAVDNISIIANYRNQFNRVINEQGFPKLMADLRAKQKQLGAELGEG
jgi:phospholipid transport system substrate-binding protein